VFREAQVMERLFHDRGSVLRLAAITCETLLRCAATALSGFAVAFLIGFGTSHRVLLRVWCVPCGVPCGRVGPQTGFPGVRWWLGAAWQTRGGSIMDFYAVLDQVLALLRQRGRVSYRALKRQFDLDDAYLDDLKVEIIEVQQCAREQEGTLLVWTGEAASGAPPEPVPAPAPLAYTPPYLAEKIFTSRSALEGERKQVTVLFADLKGSTELIAGLDPEEARQLLDPALHVMMDAVHRYEGTVNQV